MTTPSNTNFWRLWAGDAISLFGDWFTYVAVGTLIVEGGQGLVAVAIVLLAHTMPRAVLAPMAGRIVDRHDRRTIMVVATLLRALTVVAMMAAAADGALGLLQVLVFVRIGLSAFIDPAATAMLPQLLPSERIGWANAILSGTWSVMFGLGVVAGGLVTTLAGPITAMLVDALTFVISAAVFMTLPPAPPAPDPERDSTTKQARGWTIAWANPAILEAALGKLPAGLASGGAWVLIHQIAGNGVLGATAMGLGLIHASRALGTGIGPLLWVRGLRGSVAGMRASVAVSLLAAAAVAVVTEPLWILIVACVWGIGSGANWVTTSTRMQVLTPNDRLGRVASLDIVAFSLAHTCAGLLGALAADYWGLPELVAWVGAGLGLLGWLAVGLLVRASRRAAIRPARS